MTNKADLVRINFWTNPLRDTSDPNFHRAVQIALDELQGWTEEDANHLLSRIRLFCRQYRKDNLSVGQKHIVIGESGSQIGSDDLLLVLYLFQQQTTKDRHKQWFPPDSNSKALAILTLWESKQRDLHAARRAIFLAGEMLAPQAATGQKVIQGTKAAHEIAHGTEKEKATRWEAYQQEVRELHSRNPRLSYADIKRLVAKKFGVTEKTIARHTTNPT